MARPNYISRRSDLAAILTENFVNGQGSGTKISPNSNLFGLIQGCADVAQRSIKDIILAQSDYFIDESSGNKLDEVGLLYGLPNRLGATPSNVWLRLVFDKNNPPSYDAGGVDFVSTDGVTFRLDRSSSPTGREIKDGFAIGLLRLQRVELRRMLYLYL